MNLLLIAVGGALGSVSRFLLSAFITKFVRESNVALTKFPWATLGINVIGSILAGILYYFLIRNFNNINPNLKSFALIGFLGGFTTFSTFALEFGLLVERNEYILAMSYALLSVFLSITCFFVAMKLVKFLG